MTLAVFPLHREATPSCAVVLRKHSAIPSYLRSRRPDFNISSCERVSQCSLGYDMAYLGAQGCSCSKRMRMPIRIPGKEMPSGRRIIKTYLVLDQELDTLDGSGSGLGDGGGDTTHCYRSQLCFLFLSQYSSVRCPLSH